MKLLALCLVLFAATLTAKADTLYTQAPINANQSGGYLSGTHTKVADDFTLSSSATIASVSWWGSGLSDNSFVLNLFADSAGIPGTLLQSTTVQAYASVINPSQSTYLYSANISAFSASAGTRYWLEVLSDTPSDWAWMPSTAGDNEHYEDFSFFGMQSSLYNFDLAFSLSSTPATDPALAPEPSSLALLGTGLLAIGLGIRRRLLPIRQ